MSAFKRTKHGQAAMIRISFSWVHNYFTKMDSLNYLPAKGDTTHDVFVRLFEARTLIANMHGPNTLYAPHLRACIHPSMKLFEALNKIITEQPEQDIIDSEGLLEIVNLYNQYKLTLLAEFESLSLYLVTQKGPYNIHLLLEEGEKIFPEELGRKVPEAVADAQEAAKCLAYDLPTAFGFHVFRALESVLRRYHAHVTGGQAPIKNRNIGVYLRSLANSGKADPKILSALEQIKNLHRNPLIHPEAVLSPDEALMTLGISTSAIVAMLAGLPTLPQTTSTASISSLSS